MLRENEGLTRVSDCCECEEELRAATPEEHAGYFRRRIRFLRVGLMIARFFGLMVLYIKYCSRDPTMHHDFADKRDRAMNLTAQVSTLL